MAARDGISQNILTSCWYREWNWLRSFCDNTRRQTNLIWCWSHGIEPSLDKMQNTERSALNISGCGIAKASIKQVLDILSRCKTCSVNDSSEYPFSTLFLIKMDYFIFIRKIKIMEEQFFVKKVRYQIGKSFTFHFSAGNLQYIVEYDECPSRK